MNEIVSIITEFGFPVTVCVGLAFFLWKIINRIQDENKQREDNLMDCLDKFGTSQKDICSTLYSISERLSDIEQKLN